MSEMSGQIWAPNRTLMSVNSSNIYTSHWGSDFIGQNLQFHKPMNTQFVASSNNEELIGRVKLHRVSLWNVPTCLGNKKCVCAYNNWKQRNKLVCGLGSLWASYLWAANTSRKPKKSVSNITWFCKAFQHMEDAQKKVRTQPKSHTAKIGHSFKVHHICSTYWQTDRQKKSHSAWITDSCNSIQTMQYLEQFNNIKVRK